MAQSIYITLETLKTSTSVPKVEDKDGKILRENLGNINHILPRENYPTAEIFDDEEQFLEWAQEKDALLPLLQAGVGSYLITDRAGFKRMPKKGDWTPEIGQAQVDKRKWSISSRPDSAMSDEDKALNLLSKMTPEQVKEMLTKLNK